jgi:polar amino acid transport system substrate-binding protein
MKLSIKYQNKASTDVTTNLSSLRKFFTLFLFFSLATPCIASQSLLITTSMGPPVSNKSQTGFYDLIIHEAFRRINRQIDIDHQPTERSITNANSGVTDGEFPRISGLESLYPNLVRVPEKITDFEFVAFSKHHRKTMTSWDVLQAYDVAIVRGWKILEKNIINTRSLVRVKNHKLLFNLLANDRADIVVYSRLEGYATIRSLGLEGVVALEPPLAVREMYLYLNKKHEQLIKPLEQALREMKADGTYIEIKNRTLGGLSAVEP